jgi:murein DD-endopeptidase MepM/ murein hydrolase activator NlpD
MRRRTVALVTFLLLAVPGTAAAQSGGSAAPEASGGATFGVQPAPMRLVARAFSVTPATVKPGAPLTVRWRIDGRVRKAQVRVDLIPTQGGRPAATLRLGHRRTNRRLSVRWNPKLAPGTYMARLRATAARARRFARVTRSDTVQVTAPPVAVPAPAPPPPSAPATGSGVFPIRGTYSLGGAEARFGAERSGHIHQGQDILAAEGTPVVSPRAGTVVWRAYQAAGAGNYLVVRGDDGRDYVFMHLANESTLVEKGQAVAAGQQLAAVGNTGSSDGAHLHFEIWPDGWYEDGSKPIDPLPDLRAWAAAASPS